MYRNSIFTFFIEIFKKILQKWNINAINETLFCDIKYSLKYAVLSFYELHEKF